VLTVSDDGEGFADDAVEGTGIGGMRERALQVGARFRHHLGSRRRGGPPRGPGRRGGLATMPLKTRILLADDHAIVRRGVQLILDGVHDFQVVAEASDGAEAIERGLAEDVDLAILDIGMPRLTGLQAARELSRRRPDLPILILSMHDNEQYFFEALRAGASGYVLKAAADRDLIAACRAAIRR
jgi:CheY-like chemotaxis protein